MTPRGQAAADNRRKHEEGEPMDVFCGIDWAEDVRHEVACCE